MATLGAARLGLDPRTREPFVLSAEPADGAASTVDDPESALIALLFDGLAREVLPALLAREGRAADAEALRAYPIAADLYAAYRLRERLLELCPRPARGRRTEGSSRACRALVELVRPARTRRTEPPWPERERRIAASVRTLAALAPDPRVLRSLLERLILIARETAPAE